MNLGIVLGILAVVVISLSACIGLLIWFYPKYRHRIFPNPRNLKTDELDISEAVSVLCEGRYGTIRLGSFQRRSVVIKSSRDAATLTALHNEAQILHRCAHSTVAKLLGIIQQKEEISLVFEYYSHRDLRAYLHSPGSLLTTEDKCRIAEDISVAIGFLAAQLVVHRNIAAQNCLLDAGNRCRLGGFGEASRTGVDGILRVPEGELKADLMFSRLPPECPPKGPYEFSVKSDVFMFGFFLLELFNNGESPWPAYLDAEKIQSRINEGDMPDKPHAAPDEIQILMVNCWSRFPKLRPSPKLFSLKLTHIRRNLPKDTKESTHSKQKPASKSSSRLSSPSADRPAADLRINLDSTEPRHTTIEAPKHQTEPQPHSDTDRWDEFSVSRRLTNSSDVETQKSA